MEHAPIAQGQLFHRLVDQKGFDQPVVGFFAGVGERRLGEGEGRLGEGEGRLGSDRTGERFMYSVQDSNIRSVHAM